MEHVLIAGLGNPGEEYSRTRHNVGFRVADALAAGLHLRWTGAGDDVLIARTRTDTVSLILCKPLTYMNLSGIAVSSALRHFEIAPSNLLVALDDLALPLGKLRIRPQGTDGGHNGLASVIRELGTDEFPRLRCGIARNPMPHKDRIPEFVLSPFEGEETADAEAMIHRAAEAALSFAKGGLAAAMNRFNT